MEQESASVASRIPSSDKGLEHSLLEWFWKARREMPWRESSDPYAIWLSETMLQQTQVETVKPYWAKFLTKFPKVDDLARADLQEVLALWAGLGYYRRARNLHAAAQKIVAEFASRLPSDVDNLMRLPGVGHYTAGAVASIAFGRAVPVVDGNVMRVLARLTADASDIADPKSAAAFWKLAGEMHANLAGSKHKSRNTKHKTKRHLHGDLNEALMELGATVCTPQSPSCLLCPLRKFCKAFEEGRQGELPVKTKKGKTPVIRALAVIITRERATTASGATEVLLMQRPHDGLWADMWEFPVLTVEAKKSELAEVLEKEIGLRFKDLATCGKVRHQLTHRLFEYTVLRATAHGKTDVLRRPQCLGSELPYRNVRWVPWPLPKSPQFPLARVVHKIAASAQ